jgi:predicted membrane-bound spermidine synthase
LERILIYAIAFLNGAVLLGLEIVASRILAPYFGNSIYVWGSLISVFLLALSLGYWLGGVAADKVPTYRALGLIILAAGILVMVLPLVSLPVSKAIAEMDLGVRSGVLLTSTIFFLVPSVLMGMVSPYVIKLSAHDLAVIGTTAGTVYAVSTVGSIAGAIGVSFFLIPLMGTKAIVLVSGAMLLLVSTVCMVKSAQGARSGVRGQGSGEEEN